MNHVAHTKLSFHLFHSVVLKPNSIHILNRLSDTTPHQLESVGNSATPSIHHRSVYHMKKTGASCRRRRGVGGLYERLVDVGDLAVQWLRECERQLPVRAHLETILFVNTFRLLKIFVQDMSSCTESAKGN